MTRNISYDRLPDWISSEWGARQSASGNGEQLRRAERLLRQVITERLTDKQRLYLTLYYAGQQRMTDIARDCGVSLSTVSRTLTRARRRIEEWMQYYDFRGTGA